MSQKFNIGDKVKIISNLTPDKSHYKYEHEQDKFIGKVAIINIIQRYEFGYAYFVQISDKLYGFYEHDLKRISNIELI